jgi:hypothetical protein
LYNSTFIAMKRALQLFALLLSAAVLLLCGAAFHDLTAPQPVQPAPANAPAAPAAAPRQLVRPALHLLKPQPSTAPNVYAA